MSKEIQVKNYRVKFTEKPHKKNKFYEVEVRAVSEKDAIDKAYSTIGSKHGFNRRTLDVVKTTVISDDDLKNPILREIAKDDKIKLIVPEKN